MKKMNGINNPLESNRVLAMNDKESLIVEEIVIEEPNREKTGLELAGLKPCSFGKHNPNFKNSFNEG